MLDVVLNLKKNPNPQKTQTPKILDGSALPKFSHMLGILNLLHCSFIFS